jgi:sugar phosphate isomerase/epimerase
MIPFYLNKMKRREFIRSTASASLAFGVPHVLTPLKPAVDVNAHIWVYASRYPPNWDATPILESIFSDLKYAGYSGIEIMEPILKHDDAVSRLKELQQKHDIPVSGTSFHGEMYKKEEHQRILEEADMVSDRLSQVGGSTFGISVGEAGRKKTEAELDAQADLLKKMIKVCEKNRVALNMHNHTYEMEYDMHDFKGTIARVPELKLGPDLNWLVRAKVDPVWYIKTYGHKMVYMHLRDQGADGKWTDALGEGVIDFKAIAKALGDIRYDRKAAVELAFDKEPKRPVKESWKMSREFVKNTFGW